jgi:hypothetical protein
MTISKAKAGLTAICAGTVDHLNRRIRPGRELVRVNRQLFLVLDITESFETQSF